MVQLTEQQRLFYVIPIIFRGFLFQISINFSKFQPKELFLNVTIYSTTQILAPKGWGQACGRKGERRWGNMGNKDLDRKINGLHRYWQLQTANKWQTIPVKTGENSLAVHTVHK